MSSKPLPLFVLFALAVFALSSQASSLPAPTARGTEELGEEKAQVFLADEWSPAQIDPSLGPHQWSRGTGLKQSILVMREIRDLFLDEGDFVARIMLDANLTRAGMPRGSKISKPTFRRRSKLGIASVSVGGEVDGQELQFEFRLVGEGGLGYLVVVWTSKRNSREAKLHADQVVDTFLMPGPNSAWRRGLKPKTHTELVNGQRISIAAPPAWLTKDADPGDGVLALSSAGDTFAAYLFDHRFGDSLDSVLEEQAEAIGEGLGDLKMLRRATLKLDDRPARMAAYEAKSGELELFVESYVTEGGRNGTIELRVISVGADGAHRALRDSIVASLQVSDLSAAHAFPTLDAMDPDASPVPEPSYGPNPELAQLHSISTEHIDVEFPREYLTSVNNDEDGLLLNTPWGTHRFDYEDASLVEIFRCADRGDQIHTARLGTQVYVAMDGNLYTCTDGVLETLEVEADSVASFGKGGLILHREVEDSETLGFKGNRPSVSQLIARARSGTERLAYASKHRRIVDVAVRDRHVLLQLKDDSDHQADIEVVVVELGKGGQLGNAEKWRAVDSVRPAPDGWLISGEPRGAAPGTYLMGLEGERERLLDYRRVNVLGLSKDERLYYVGSGRGRTADMYKLRSVPLDDLKKAGALKAPWSAIDLGDLARAALPDEGLGNTGEAAFKRWMPFLERASKLSEERFGCGFPIHPEPVDTLIDMLSGSEELDEDGRQLLVAVAIRSLAAEGGIWAVSPSTRPIGVSPTGHTESNELAVGINVATAVFEVGNPDSKAYQIVQSTLNGLEGRQLFIGTDSGTLRRAVAGTRNPLMQIAFDKVGLEELKELTDASPANTLLRRFLYRRLVQFERTEVAEALAKHHASGGEPSYMDLALTLGAIEPTKGSVEDTIQRLKDAIRSFPYAADFYVLLGEAYEVQRGENYRELAYACFAHADSFFVRDPLASRIEDGLERTGDS